MDAEKIKHEILFQAVNATKNRDLLEQAPHQRYLDLALVFFYLEETEDHQKRTFILSNQQMRRLGVTKEQVTEWAMENTPRLLPPSFHSMEQAQEDQPPMYVLTNVRMFLGAACLFYPRVLPSIRNAVQEDFYIIPSSVHECIILPMSDAYTKSELEKIVYEVNLTQVPEQEVLSNYVYFYQKSTGKFHK